LKGESATLRHELTRFLQGPGFSTDSLNSDLLAELTLPHSGIVNLQGGFPFPQEFQYEGEDPVATEDLWYISAEISLRSLLNSVTISLYTSKDNGQASMQLDRDVSDLDDRLETWYRLLPGPIQFSLDEIPSNNPVTTVLRLRYFACRTIIFRQYVHRVLTRESYLNDPGVEDRCQKCLDACIQQLRNIRAQ